MYGCDCSIFKFNRFKLELGTWSLEPGVTYCSFGFVDCESCFVDSGIVALDLPIPFSSSKDSSWNLELGAWNLELGAWNFELGAWRLGTWNLELGAWSLELGAWSLEFGT